MEHSNFALDVPNSLIARARAGELGAFEQIYRLFERPVYTLALRLMNHSEDAREVLQDAMLQVYERLAQFRGEAPFWAWLRQIAVNTALMRLRRGRWIETSGEVPESESPEPGPWLAAEGANLADALAKLPSATRSVLWLYHVEGYTHDEIAGLTGNSISFSKSQLARGTARLRGLLNPQPEVSLCANAPLTA